MRSLAVKYRPSTWDEVTEQGAIKNILQEQIATGTQKHAYLFVGPAGCGKTTCARIFANDLNEGKGNPIEIDAASNSGVDNVRTIVEEAKKKPIGGEYKVFIVDECFHADTMIDTPIGKRHIASINPGDSVIGLQGNATVLQVFKNRVLTSRLCCVTIGGKRVITTVDHLFFTDRGWVPAKDLIKGELLYGVQDVQEVWQELYQSAQKRDVLLQQVFSLLYKQTAQKQRRACKIGNLRRFWDRYSRCVSELSLFQDLPSRDHSAEEYRKAMFRIETLTTEKAESCERSSRIDGGKGKWEAAFCEIATVEGRKKIGAINSAKVDAVDLYERGGNDEIFRCYFSDAELHEGVVTMYDLEIEGHPSYCAEGAMVHNCHATSNTGWQAYLKLLEEPPASAVFVFCTTDPQKIPATIISRVQRYDFNKMSWKGIRDRLEYILDQENSLDSVKKSLWLSSDALDYVVKLANGGMRDAITMLDQCLSYKEEIELEDVLEVLGEHGYDTMFALMFGFVDRDKSKIISILNSVYSEGKDLKQFIRQFMLFMMDVCTYKVFDNFDLIGIPDVGEYSEWMDNEAEEDLISILRWAQALYREIKWDANPYGVVIASAYLEIA